MVKWVVDRRGDKGDLPLWNLRYAIKDVTPEIRTLSKLRLSLPAWNMQNEKLETRSPLIHSSIKTEKMPNLQCRFVSEF
jgi:hypothetical protein